MKKVLILVEGQTEEQFIKRLLSDDFKNKGIYLKAIILKTKKVASRKDHKGGVTSYQRFCIQMKNLLGDTSAAGVSMMIDLYGLPKDFPGMDEASHYEGEARAKCIEDKMKEEFNDKRFIPYLSVYEFEALLFSDSNVYTHSQKKTVSKILDDFNDEPERINDSPETAPSKRLRGIIPSYQKVANGLILAQGVGLEKMRDKCPHFHEWIDSLENLSHED